MDKILLVFVLCVRMKLIRRRALARGAAVLLLCCSAGVQGLPVERRRRRPQGHTL